MDSGFYFCFSVRVGAAIYFSSRASSWVTGTVLNVDGGTVGSAQIPLSSL